MKQSYFYLVPTLVALSGGASAEVRITSNVATSYVNTDVTSQQDLERGADVFTVTPTLGLLHQSKKLATVVNVSHQYVDRSISGADDLIEAPETTDNYTDYDYSATLSVIDNALSIFANGSQSYRNRDITNALVFDRFVGSNDLTKTHDNTLGFNLSPREPAISVPECQGRYSDVKTDEQSDSSIALDNTNKFLAANLYSGDRIDWVNWDASFSTQETEDSFRQDTTSET